MKFMTGWFLPILVVLSAPTDTIPESSNRGFFDGFLDIVLDRALPILDRLILTKNDPLNLTNTLLGLSYKPFFINYTGGVELSEGKLKGLSTLKRYGHTDTVFKNKVAKVTGRFSFDYLLFYYKYHTQIMNIGPRGSVEATFKNIDIRMCFSVNFTKFHAKLDEFEITKSGIYTVKYTGVILVDWLSDIMTTVIVNLLKIIINTVVQRVVYDSLNDALSHINSGAELFSSKSKAKPAKTRLGYLPIDQNMNFN